MIILRQKAYGKVGRFIDKISGGRISKALEKSIEKDRALRDKAKSDFIFGDKVVNPEIEKKLANEASKRGIKIVNTKSSGISMNEVIKSSDNNSNSYKLLKGRFGDKKTKLIKDSQLNGDKYQLIHPENSGTEMLAKDIGKIDNEITGSGLSRKIRNHINKKSKNKKLIDDFYEDGLLDSNNGSGIGEGISRYFKRKPIVKEEQNSSKIGLKLLEKSGMKGEELFKSKNNLENADNIYKYGSRVYYKTPLLNSMKKKPKNKK